MSANPQEGFPVDRIQAMSPEAVFEALIRQAVRVSASDLFVLSDEESVRLSLRWLGAMHVLAHVSREQGRHILNHIKAEAGMDIAERRRPLSGRNLYQVDESKLDLRLNCVPTLYGEDLSIRMLDRKVGLLKLEHLGLSRTEQSRLSALLSSPSGLILVTGPTGTGKTTTLYACVQYLNNGERKINTLEDPIEYGVRGVRQSQVQPTLGVDFPELLRNVLRQSPDVIMIGEIRDQETATTAVRAANSGHLVLATLHAPVAAHAVQNMLALGAHPYFLSNCLLGVIAQRLVRVLNPETRVAYDITDSPATFADIAHLLAPGGGKCMYGPGGKNSANLPDYVARTGLFEVLMVNREVRRLIAAGSTAELIEQQAIADGMLEFRRAALLQVAQGVTSIEEMMRVVPSVYLGAED
ncbi:MAG TPA: ATPase, T2SS/T4P/T4SS family [Pirellulaceae bacterium]|nr:ATPase, T2SS/T4P/T4SS family [Pirellulaceae bacterium]